MFLSKILWINYVIFIIDNAIGIKYTVFEIKKKLERIMVNPSTQQRMLVPPKLVLNFKPAPTLKEKVKKGGE